MRADVKAPTNKVLKKYSITLKEYAQIAEEAAAAVSFGNCGWCS
jgi:hypothetical protein